MRPQTLDKINEYIKNNKNYIENEFIKEILEIKSISNKERIELVNRIKNGDNSANKDLIYYSLKDALAVAINFYNENIQLMDLVEKGSLHVIEIAKKVDLDKYIYQSYFQHCLINIFKNYINIRKTNDEHIQDYKNNIQISYDVEDSIILNYDISELMNSVKLSKRERLVLKLVYWYKLTEIEIANILNISQPRVHQILVKAYRKIIQSKNVVKLDNYLAKPISNKQKIIINRIKMLNETTGKKSIF